MHRTYGSGRRVAAEEPVSDDPVGTCEGVGVFGVDGDDGEDVGLLKMRLYRLGELQTYVACKGV